MGGGATDTAGGIKTSGATDTLCRAVGQPLAWKMTGVGATDTVDEKLILLIISKLLRSLLYKWYRQGGGY